MHPEVLSRGVASIGAEEALSSSLFADLTKYNLVVDCTKMPLEYKVETTAHARKVIPAQHCR